MKRCVQWNGVLLSICIVPSVCVCGYCYVVFVSVSVCSDVSPSFKFVTSDQVYCCIYIYLFRLSTESENEYFASEFSCYGIFYWHVW